MHMKDYLIDTFRFNDTVNRNLLTKIATLTDQQQSIRMFSHLVNSQNKWLERIRQYPHDPGMDWWEPAYPLDHLAGAWETSVQSWIGFLREKSEEELFADADFIGYDGGHWAAPLKDIALQLNYHSIHHRAQIQLFIRQEGIEPDFVDYIGTVYRKMS